MERRIRPFDHDRDLDDVVRIWREVRWIESGAEHAKAVGLFLEDVDSEVGTLDDTPECLVVRRPGRITYDTTDLPLVAVAAVTTSHVGRKLGFASTMTARAVAAGGHGGAAVAALGMFEQGFYDRFGFATGSYDHRAAFDPQTLRVGHIPYRTPVRLGPEDASDMAAALRNRMAHHGAVTLDGDAWQRAEISWIEDPIALGYRDETGELTHFLAGSLKEEHGPLDISMLAYRTIEELMELLRLLRELGDQVRSVVMNEPPMVQLQVLLDTPMRHRPQTRLPGSESSYVAWWQLRILDLAACVAARRWEGEPIAFDLRLSDPVADHLDAADLGGWTGIGGDYSIRIAAESTVDSGHRGGLPVVECDVGALTRLWFGVASAAALAVTHRFSAPSDLVDRLDHAFRLPPTVPGIYF
ncbi:sterol carrier protein domain-containing protein [Ilumatobacter nonamiensis]|uniref:sterol carrier protein domain-containing protein n=1 Tax=Ilumatobacter nonamiensis TaxID=467093 RepID=UPI00130E69CF|nr:sterol carrier protein domain-containing protein [Ilumatobacter nonamiensis]